MQPLLSCNQVGEKVNEKLHQIRKGKTAEDSTLQK